MDQSHKDHHKYEQGESDRADNRGENASSSRKQPMSEMRETPALVNRPSANRSGETLTATPSEDATLGDRLAAELAQPVTDDLHGEFLKLRSRRQKRKQRKQFPVLSGLLEEVTKYNANAQGSDNGMPAEQSGTMSDLIMPRLISNRENVDVDALARSVRDLEIHSSGHITQLRGLQRTCNDLRRRVDAFKMTTEIPNAIELDARLKDIEKYSVKKYKERQSHSAAQAKASANSNIKLEELELEIKSRASAAATNSALSELMAKTALLEIENDKLRKRLCALESLELGATNNKLQKRLAEVEQRLNETDNSSEDEQPPLRERIDDLDCKLAKHKKRCNSRLDSLENYQEAATEQTSAIEKRVDALSSWCFYICRALRSVFQAMVHLDSRRFGEKIDDAHTDIRKAERRDRDFS